MLALHCSRRACVSHSDWQSGERISSERGLRSRAEFLRYAKFECQHQLSSIYWYLANSAVGPTSDFAQLSEKQSKNGQSPRA